MDVTPEALIYWSSRTKSELVRYVEETSWLVGEMPPLQYKLLKESRIMLAGRCRTLWWKASGR
jgi:hypothetical protein